MSWEKKKKKTIGHITPTIGHYPMNGKIGDTDSSSDMLF